MRIIRYAILLLVLGLTVSGARYAAHQYRAPLAADSAPSPAPTSSPLPDISVTVVQIGSAGRRLITCLRQQCTTLYPPPAVTGDTVTDGQAWYFYANGALKKIAPDNSESVLVSENPLVKPNRLFISPDTTKVAFWLDNIADPRERLTELWAYDDTEGSTKLLAEKISQPDVLTSPRWNRSSTLLWFVGDTGTAGQPSQPELLVASLSPPGIVSRFAQVDWQQQTALAKSGAMDISADGERLAYAEAKTSATSKLFIIEPDNEPAATTVRGQIVYIQWLDDQSLLYAAQDNEGVTFWRVREALHRHLISQSGLVQSVSADREGRYLTFTVRSGPSVRIVTANTATGQLAAPQTLPPYGTATFIVRVSPLAGEPAAARESTQLDDAVLAGVIEHHLPSITRLPDARPRRLIITDRPNTLYVDYADAAGRAHRLLLTIYEPTQPAWSINARYRESAGEWVKTVGGGLSDPQPVRLYEWEPPQRKWILKEEY